MDLDLRYTEVLEEMKKGHRALIRFERNELEYLSSSLENSLERTDEKMEKLLCLIEHSATLYPPFSRPLLKALSLDLPDQVLVFALNCARKHIVQASGQQGQRLSYDFLELLKKHLHSQSPEVVEWTLRTIEECGNQGVYFLREFDKIKPPPWKWFNPHQRAVREIIAMLERRWAQFERH